MNLQKIANLTIFGFALGCNSELLGQIYAPAEFMFGFNDGICRLYDTRYSQEDRDEDEQDIEVLGKYGFINRSGKLIAPFLYERAKDFHDGRALVGVRTRSDSIQFKYGFIDKLGLEVIPPQFEEALDFSSNMAAFKKNGLWGYLDLNGKIAIIPKFIDAHYFSEGLASAQDEQSKLWGYINTSGEWAIKPMFGKAVSFSDGLAAIKSDKGNMWGFVDKSGKLVIPCKYRSEDYLPKFSDGFANCQAYDAMDNNNRSYIIDKSGSPAVFFEQGKPVGAFSNGLMLVRDEGGKYGYAGVDGKLVIGFKYEKAFAFNEGLAAVIIDGKCGYINTNGEIVIHPKFTVYDYEFNSASPCFSDGLATVEEGIINKKGELVFKTVKE